MAECSYARCMQERLMIKKRLQKWTKNCIYTLGFERVAEEFMGRRQWRLYQERVLKSWCPSIESDIGVKDWDPTEDKCNFCDLDPTGKETDEETKSPPQSDSLIEHHNNNIDLLGSDSSDSSEELPGSMNTLDSVSSMAAIAALASPQGLPFYPHGGFPRWYLSPPPPGRGLLEAAKPESPMVMNVPATPGAEMPLDLSAKSSKTPPAESPENIRVPSMIDPKSSLFGSRPRMSPMSGRRTYTEDELQAALRDIQSGKLGTRRAAVIYGIPRSTLRNKVYKLALERERDAHVLLGAPLPRPSPPDASSLPPTLLQPEREESNPEEDKESGSQPGLTMEEIIRLSADRGAPNSVLASYLAQLLKLSPSGDTDTTALLKRLIGEEKKNGIEEDQSSVILRIPSFPKPSAETHEKPPVNGDSAEGGASLREAIIAKTISPKFPSDMPPGIAFSHHASLHHQQQPQHQTQPLQLQQQQQQQSRPSAQGKGTRPKRGKYRNYDRDSLVEAVRAVQRGEMSVHRAGSYYGVPHSTLEYKVKERHLMRPRKREPKVEDKSKVQPTPAPLDKGKQSPLAPKPLAKPAFPPPNGLKLPPSLFDTGVNPLATFSGGPFSYWPPHPFPGLPMPPTPEHMFHPSLPAATRRIAESLYDGSGHNGTFLDGIIRSSLEHDLKSVAEKSGKITQHMSNKALIDQLCLNSRVPPVPPVPPGPPLARSSEPHSDDDRPTPFDQTRSSDDDDEDRMKRMDDNDVPTPDEDEDMDNISNHASEEDEPQDS